MPKTVDDLVRELSQVQNIDELREWKRGHEVTSDLISAVAAAVPRLIEAAEFGSADRLADWLVALAEGCKPIDQARALTAKGIVLARIDRHPEALPYFDSAIAICQDVGDEPYAAKIRRNRIASYSTLLRYDEAFRDA